MNAKSTRARQLRLNREANAVLAIMRAGRHLHLEFRNGVPRWFLDDGQSVSAGAAKLVTFNSEIAGEANSLFPGITAPQTFYLRGGSK
jgi:hypothetical protein